LERRPVRAVASLATLFVCRAFAIRGERRACRPPRRDTLCDGAGNAAARWPRAPSRKNRSPRPRRENVFDTLSTPRLPAATPQAPSPVAQRVELDCVSEAERRGREEEDVMSDVQRRDTAPWPRLGKSNAPRPRAPTLSLSRLSRPWKRVLTKWLTHWVTHLAWTTPGAGTRPGNGRPRQPSRP
jgi:hypothetical protein